MIFVFDAEYLLKIETVTPEIISIKSKSTIGSVYLLKGLVKLPMITFMFTLPTLWGYLCDAKHLLVQVK